MAKKNDTLPEGVCAGTAKWTAEELAGINRIKPIAATQSAPEAFALQTVDADVTRTVTNLTGVVAFLTQMTHLRSVVEFSVGPLSVVLADGEVDGVRFGLSGQIEHMDGLELLEAGAYLYALGVTIRRKEVAGAVAAGAAAHRAEKVAA